MILLFSLLGAYFAVLVVSFWVDKFGGDLSGKGMLLTGLISFLAILLLQLFAPESMITPVLLIGVGIIVFTLIISQIFKK